MNLRNISTRFQHVYAIDFICKGFNTFPSIRGLSDSFLPLPARNLVFLPFCRKRGKQPAHFLKPDAGGYQPRTYYGTTLIFLKNYFYFFAASGLSCCTQHLSLRHVGSVVVARGLSCPVACGILVSRPGIKPASPALQDGFLTTGPPGKSRDHTHFEKITVILFSDRRNSLPSQATKSKKW